MTAAIAAAAIDPRAGDAPFVNARFRGRAVTGVERYALEVSRRLDPSPRYLDAPGRSGGLAGHLWEQFVLPSRAHGGVLWSPCNTGPLMHDRHVVTIHDAAFADRRECFSPHFAAWYNWLLPRLARRARAVVTVSEFSRSRIAAVCGVDPSKIAVVPNGVDARFRPPSGQAIAEARARLGISGGYILGLGSLEPRKNLRGLLRAWAILRERFPSLRLALAGTSGGARFREGGLAESDLAGVRLLGYVDDALLPALYAGARAFVYPSIYEGFGLPPLEAMACGTPVVCSGTTALPEVAAGAARMVDPDDAGEIARGVAAVLESQAYADDLRRRGIERASQFTWDRTASAIRAILLNVASEAGS